MKWSWQEVASWVDTEGTIGSDFPKGGSFGYVAQKERTILEVRGRFLESEGFRVRLRLDKPYGVYRLHIDGAEQTARLIKSIKPFIRTTHRKERIAVFRETLSKPRKLLRPEMRNARRILELGDNHD